LRTSLKRLAALAVSLALAACGALPKPFEHDGPAPNELLVLKDRAGIIVAPMDGDLPADADLMIEAMADRLRALHVPATTHALNRGTRVLQGHAERRPSNPERLSVAWELWDLDGRLVGTYVQEQPLGSLADSRGENLIATLTEEAAPKIAALIQDPRAREARVPGFPGARLVVAALAAGPGDSAQSLSAALRGHLVAADLPVADRAAPDDLLILGKVELGPTAKGYQEVAVRWSVVTARDGRELGQVEQRNQVPAGRLDGPWGPIAGAVAEGAASGIVDLLNRAATAKD
jgi:hypothetical protein